MWLSGNKSTYSVGKILTGIFALAALVIFSVPHVAKAVVPVTCPSPCETWDVALSGKSSALGGILPFSSEVESNGIFDSLLNSSKESWFHNKESNAAASTLSDPFGSLLQAFTSSFSWDSLAWKLGNKILHQFTQGIVTWIRTGQDPFFSGGTSGSLFVTNIDKFLLDGADNAASVFLSEYYGDTTWNQLCTPFRDLVGLGISRSYGRDYGSFKFQAECTIQDIVANVEDFYNDFENGGWEAWLASGSYANNPWGLLALGEETSRSRQSRASSANLNDFMAGLGFPGLRECPPENQLPGATPNGKPLCKNNGYITVTPGKAIENQLESAMGVEIDKLGAADELNEIVAALMDQMLTWLLSGGSGSGGILGSDDLPDWGDDPPPGVCSPSIGRPNACQCTINTQCASNFCSPTTRTCAPAPTVPPPPPPPPPPPTP